MSKLAQKNRQQLISPQPAQDFFVNLGSTGPTTNPVFFVTRPFFHQLVSTPQQFPVRREAIDQRPQTLGHLCHLEGHPLFWGWMLVPMDVAAARTFLLGERGTWQVIKHCMAMNNSLKSLTRKLNNYCGSKTDIPLETTCLNLQK